MKEGISYSFLLNIIIIFIFVCVAIVMGIFSYYRAFRANTIIVNAIEKYEGYNCHSKGEIESKLNSISYNVPFDVKCKSSYGKHCTTDANHNYAVVSINLDYEKNDNNQDNDMDSWIDGASYTKNYQYGVYTYMYIDLPVIAQMLKLSFFSKTKELHEFRNLYLYQDENTMKLTVSDLDFIPDNYLEENAYLDDAVKKFATDLLYIHNEEQAELPTDSINFDSSRLVAQYVYSSDAGEPDKNQVQKILGYTLFDDACVEKAINFGNF